jgi:hypothetical protein
LAPVRFCAVAGVVVLGFGCFFAALRGAAALAMHSSLPN